MPDPIKEEQKLYEKLSNKSLKAQHKLIYGIYTLIGVLSALIVTEFFVKEEYFPTWRVIGIIIGAVIGFLIGVVLVMRGKNIASELSRLELSEGYSDATLAEAYRMIDKKQSNVWRATNTIIAGMIHNFRGEFSKTIELYSGIDESIFAMNAANAHNYYASLLMAYLLVGDLDHAADTYNRGLYYLRTYMNSPTSGVIVSQSLAVFEFYAGHYDVSLQLLDNAIRVGSADVRPEQRVPNENMTSIICYWKAVVFASMGNKAAAWEMINYCKDFYKTPYYESMCKKLLDDMAEDEKNKKNTEMITDAQTFS